MNLVFALLVHLVVRGDHLDDIARDAYGSRHYSRVIEIVDHVDATKLKVGAELPLPSLEEICAPLATRVPDGTAALLRAYAVWRVTSPLLWREHRTTRAITSHAEVGFAQDQAERARAAFAKAGLPTRELQHLVDELGGVAAGSIDPEGYGIDGVDRRFAYAIAELLTANGSRGTRGRAP